MHTFPNFVVRLKNIFCILALIFVFDVNIYYTSSRLFKIDSVINLLTANHGQYVILVLSLQLRWFRVTFVLNTLTALKKLLFMPMTLSKVKRLSISVLVILWIYL